MCQFLSGHYVLKTQGNVKKGSIILPKNLMSHEDSMEEHGLKADTAVPWEYVKGKLDIRFEALGLTEDTKKMITFEVEHYLKNTIRQVIPKYYEWLNIWNMLTGEKLEPSEVIESNGLTHLNLRHNQLTAFEGKWPSLGYLDLTNNQLTAFEGKCPSLRYLDLGHNQLNKTTLRELEKNLPGCVIM